MLADEKSRYVVDAIVSFRNRRIPNWRKIKSSDETYFEKGLYPYTALETIVDMGAYDGDTMLSFKKFFGGWKKYYAMEPTSEQYGRLKIAAEGLSDVSVIQAAAGDYDGETYISSEGVGSQLNEHGIGEKVKVVRLDSLDLPRVTFIKADIEGAELSALRGAKDIIMRDKPTLAICVYHKNRDLWEIPFLVKEYVPEYNIYIRHYGNNNYDTVMYAVLQR